MKNSKTDSVWVSFLVICGIIIGTVFYIYGLHTQLDFDLSDAIAISVPFGILLLTIYYQTEQHKKTLELQQKRHIETLRVQQELHERTLEKQQELANQARQDEMMFKGLETCISYHEITLRYLSELIFFAHMYLDNKVTEDTVTILNNIFSLNEKYQNYFIQVTLFFPYRQEIDAIHNNITKLGKICSTKYLNRISDLYEFTSELEENKKYLLNAISEFRYTFKTYYKDYLPQKSKTPPTHESTSTD